MADNILPDAVELDIVTMLTAAGEGEKINVTGDLVTVKVSSEQSGGQYFVFEELTPPGGGPPPHYHRQAEIFYVLEGDVDFLTFIDGEPNWIQGHPGAVCSIPSMAHHTFRNSGTTESRVLAITMPGGMDHFFRAIGEPSTADSAPGMTGPPDLARIQAASEKYGVVFL